MIGTPYGQRSRPAGDVVQGKGHSGRILEFGQDINELWAGAECFFQVIGVHAVIIGGDGDIFGAVGIPGLKRAQVGGGFDQDTVSAVDKDLARSDRGPAESRSDQNIIGRHLDAVTLACGGRSFRAGAVPFG